MMPLNDPNTAIALVKGLVDAIQYPAFVTSPTFGVVACNKSAKSIKCPTNNEAWSDGDVVDVSNKKYRVVRKKLNHKTDFILVELHSVTDLAERLKFAGDVLDKALLSVNGVY